VDNVRQLKVTGPEPWNLSVPDWEHRLLNGQSIIPVLNLDWERANRAVAVFKRLRIPDVPGTPTLGEAGGQWILDIVAAIFGAFDIPTQQRMIRGLFLLVPKKNAKTTYGAALMLTAMILNKRPLAEMLLTAPSHEISGKAFSQVKGMILLDEEGYLQKRFHIRDHVKNIEDRKTHAMLKIKTFDASIVTGAVPAAALIDEVHLLGNDQQAEAIIGQLTGGMISVPEAWWGMITTQSFKPPQGVFKSELRIARDIRDGNAPNIDTLSILYEFSEDQQKDRTFWENPKNWELIQPNLNKSVWIPGLIKNYNKALRKGDDAIAIWASQHLNIQMGLGLHSGAWVGARYWESRANPELQSLDYLLEWSDICTVGMDGGGLADLFGLAVLGRHKVTGNWMLWAKAWVYRSVLETNLEVVAKLRDLEKLGELSIPETLGDDIEEACDIVNRIYKAGLLPGESAIGVDPVGIDEIEARLRQPDIGIGLEDKKTDKMVVGVSQGWRMSGIIKSVERRLVEGTFEHGGQEIMNWCVGNARTVASGNAVNITKAVSGSAKIDPLMAAFDAATLMALNPQRARKPKHQFYVIG
jgi:phage terminase large subunit-like protein